MLVQNFLCSTKKYKSGKVSLDDLQLVSDMRSIPTHLSSVNLVLRYFQVIAATYNISGCSDTSRTCWMPVAEPPGKINSPQLLELLYLPISFNGREEIPTWAPLNYFLPTRASFGKDRNALLLTLFSTQLQFSAIKSNSKVFVTDLSALNVLFLFILFALQKSQ